MSSRRKANLNPPNPATLAASTPLAPPARPRVWLLALGLALLTLAVFWPATGYDFINLDDETYVYENPHVATGLTWENVRWAFTSVHQDWWLPLLWLSYMLDIRIFGFGPYGHHLVNIVLHAANVILLFWALQRMTGARWRSAFVAALFALHPQRVESVVWITERKDVLSGFFWMLAMAAYAYHAPRPGWRRFWPVPLFMLLGLMSKATPITFPFAMLLLDFWPLRRAGAPFAPGAWRQWRPLLLEKWPLFLLTAASATVNFLTLWAGKPNYAGTPWLVRVCLIPANYLAYLAKTIWPAQLAVVYPERDIVSIPLLAIALLVLGGVTWLFVRRARRFPFLIVGWLWFLGNLFPVIRGIRLGIAAMADRFTYLPGIGLAILLAWAAAEILPAFLRRKTVLATAAALLLAASAWALRDYMAYWRSSEPLFLRTLAVTRDNWLIPVNLGSAYIKLERYEDALAVLEPVVSKTPFAVNAHIGIGVALDRLERKEEAERHFQQALTDGRTDWYSYMQIGELFLHSQRYTNAAAVYRQALLLKPRDKDTLHNLGVALIEAGQPEEALPYLLDVQRLDPRFHTAFFLGGKALLGLGRAAEAMAHFRRAVELQPRRVEYLSALAVALGQAGQVAEAIDLLKKAERIDPESPELLNNLAWTLAATPEDGLRRPAEALEYAQRAADLSKRKLPGILDTLAVAYAAAGDYTNALAICQEAIQLAEAQTNTMLKAKLLLRSNLFAEGRPWMDAH